MTGEEREGAKPRLIDFCCGPGGAAKGYQRAGFYVVGVDIEHQPNYCGDDFIQADALEVLADFDPTDWAAAHASPPCQHYSLATAWRGDRNDHPDLVGTFRELLNATGLPWVIENVPEAPTTGITLCGSQFGLNVRRHRRFETSWEWFEMRPPCSHGGLLPFMHKGERAYADAMGCVWMTKHEARQAIPPCYTELIGTALLNHLIKDTP